MCSLLFVDWCVWVVVACLLFVVYGLMLSLLLVVRWVLRIVCPSLLVVVWWLFVPS